MVGAAVVVVVVGGAVVVLVGADVVVGADVEVVGVVDVVGAAGALVRTVTLSTLIAAPPIRIWMARLPAVSVTGTSKVRHVAQPPVEGSDTVVAVLPSIVTERVAAVCGVEYRRRSTYGPVAGATTVNPEYCVAPYQ